MGFREAGRAGRGAAAIPAVTVGAGITAIQGAEIQAATAAVGTGAIGAQVMIAGAGILEAATAGAGILGAVMAGAGIRAAATAVRGEVLDGRLLFFAGSLVLYHRPGEVVFARTPPAGSRRSYPECAAPPNSGAAGPACAKIREQHARAGPGRTRRCRHAS